MEIGEEIDQFELLERKVDALIAYITTLTKEKDSLAEKAQILEEKISDMTGELEGLRTARDSAKLRIVSLLEKIEQFNL